MRYWIGVASKEHVALGVAGGFCQLCHGKAQPLKRMAIDDWIIYYSPKLIFGEVAPCQAFTAIGQVTGHEVYPHAMAPGFIPHRRDIHFLPADEAPIRPLVDALSFIKNKRQWGYAFRFGHLEIPRVDFELIAVRMLGRVPVQQQAG